MTAHQRPLTAPGGVLQALREALADWRNGALGDPRLLDNELHTIGVLHRAFSTLIGWIEVCPSQCQEAGWWWDGGSLADIALALPDLVDIARTGLSGDGVALLRGLRVLDSKGWVEVDKEWRVLLRISSSLGRRSAARLRVEVRGEPPD